MENKMLWEGKKYFNAFCILTQNLCIPPRDFVSACKTLVMEMLWGGKIISVLLWENNTVLEREHKCNVALLRTNANILLANPEFHWGMQYFWKRTQMFVSEISLKMTAFPTKLRSLTKHWHSLEKVLSSYVKLCVCSQNICVLSQIYCFPHRNTFCSLAKH